MDSTAAAATLDKKNDALRRAIPLTRLVDYGVALGDALSMHSRTGGEAPEDWSRVGEALAGTHAQAARKAEALGRALTAADEWRQAAALYQAAQLACNDDTADKRRLYEQGRQAYLAHALCTQGQAEGRVSELRLESEAGLLYGWLVAPAVMPAREAVVLVGGMSGWGAVYLDMALALARRGVLCVLAEGPGQGSTRLRSGLHLSASNFPLFGRFIDHVEQTGAQRIGVWGNSIGGLFAARLAATDERVRAVCINGAPMKPTVPDFRTAREQMHALLGLADEGELSRGIAALGLDASQHRIGASMLVVEGGRDPFVPLGAQHEFFALAPGRGRVLSWADGEHTIYNHAAQRNALVADWFCEALQG